MPSRLPLSAPDPAHGGHTGAEVRQLRQSVQLSQLDLARRLHYCKQHLCHVEHERRRVTPLMWRAVIEVIEAERAAQAELRARHHRLAS